MASHPTPRTAFMAAFVAQLAAARAACVQERTHRRLVLLSLALLTSLGRHTITQLLVTLGVGDADWAAWYRLFSTPRVVTSRLGRQTVATLVAVLDRRAPLVVALDATHLYRSGKRMPGTGWVRAAATAVFRRGLARAQRWVGLNGLLPRSAAGDSRAVPLRWIPAPTPKATALAGHPPRKEWEAGVRLLGWLRRTLDSLGQRQRRILAVADGSYSGAALWMALPARVTLLARCARNRALYALKPVDDTDRRRKYGTRLPTPQQMLAERTGWQTVPILVRGRTVRLRVKVVGPCLVKPAAAVPLFLIVVRGVAARPAHRRRQPTSLLVNARRDGHGGWMLPYPVAELLGWAWQRWEVEVLHRELKSGFGLGQQQAWSAAGTVAVTQWVVWVYACVVLAGYQAWGYAVPAGSRLGRWHAPRRWSLGMLWQQARTELWGLTEMQPRFARSPDTWAAMTAWWATQTSASRGYRRI
jgi:hypothetical protein